MKIKLLSLVFLLFVVEVFSQDSIVNFLDKQGKIVSKRKATEFEILLRKDTLWQATKYYRNGKVKRRGHFKTEEKKTPVGEFVGLNRKGKMSLRLLYNLEGKKHGKYYTWFDNGNLNVAGIYVNGKKEGLWKFHHYNGGEASRIYFINDSIIRSIKFDEQGQSLGDCPCEIRKPEFKGGIKKFNSKLKNLLKLLDYQLNGKIHVYFVISIDNKITDVQIDEVLPEDLSQQIVRFFENIEGWKHGVHNNRKYPVQYSIALNFGSN